MRELFADFPYQGDFLVLTWTQCDAYKIPIYIDQRHKMFSSKMIPNCLKKHQPVPVQCISESDGYSICAGCFDTIM